MSLAPLPLRKLSKAEDLADAETILHFLRAAETGSHRPSVANRACREAVQKYWQEPRFPASAVKRPAKLRSQFALGLYWSPAARDVLASGTYANALALEHVVPISTVVKHLRATLQSEPDTTPEQMTERLTHVHTLTPFAVVTPQEHAVLDNSIVIDLSTQGGPFNPWARYHRLDLSDFRPVRPADLLPVR